MKKTIQLLGCAMVPPVETTQVWPKMLKWNFETCTVPWIKEKRSEPNTQKNGKKNTWKNHTTI